MSWLMQIVGGAALVVFSLSTPAPADTPTRDLGVVPKVTVGSVPISGDYWALIIGINRYAHAPRLDTAVTDALGIRDVLIERYGFQRGRIIELLNEQATRTNIEQELYQLGQRVGREDSVFIYYAGHGQYDEDGNLGWWIPVEGQPNNPGTFITNASIRDYVKGMKSRHVYLVADSCFSGTLFGSRALPPINDQWIARLAVKQSRWGLTSGGTEPVADKGKDGHSPFAYHLINLLRENADPYLIPSRIVDRLAPLVANMTDQTPRSEPIRGAGDEGGQFVFRLSTGLEPTAPSVGMRPLQQPPKLEDDFSISVALNKSAFHDKDEAELRIVPSRDAYVHIFNIAQDQAITILLPNRLSKANFVRANEPLVFPTAEQRRMGIRLQVRLPSGAKRTVEEIKVVATKRSIDISKGKIPEGIFQFYSNRDTALAADVQRELSTLEPSEWTGATIPYEIGQ